MMALLHNPIRRPLLFASFSSSACLLHLQESVSPCAFLGLCFRQTLTFDKERQTRNDKHKDGSNNRHDDLSIVGRRILQIWTCSIPANDPARGNIDVVELDGMVRAEHCVYQMQAAKLTLTHNNSSFTSLLSFLYRRQVEVR